jgi:hypothetical protein
VLVAAAAELGWRRDELIRFAAFINFNGSAISSLVTIFGVFSGIMTVYVLGAPSLMANPIKEVHRATQFVGKRFQDTNLGYPDITSLDYSLSSAKHEIILLLVQYVGGVLITLDRWIEPSSERTYWPLGLWLVFQFLVIAFFMLMYCHTVIERAIIWKGSYNAFLVFCVVIWVHLITLVGFYGLLFAIDSNFGTIPYIILFSFFNFVVLVLALSIKSIHISFFSLATH